MHHAGQRFRFADIKVGNQRMWMRAAQHFDGAGVGGNPVFDIARFGLDHFGGVGFRVDLTHHRQIVAERRRSVAGDAGVGFARHRQIDHLIILLPARITAEQARQRIVDLVAARCGDTIQ